MSYRNLNIFKHHKKKTKINDQFEMYDLVTVTYLNSYPLAEKLAKEMNLEYWKYRHSIIDFIQRDKHDNEFVLIGIEDNESNEDKKRCGIRHVTEKKDFIVKLTDIKKVE